MADKRPRDLETVRRAFSHNRTKQVVIEKPDPAERAARRATHDLKLTEIASAKIAARATAFEPTSLEITFLKMGMEPWKIISRDHPKPAGDMIVAQQRQERAEDLTYYRDHKLNAVAETPALPGPVPPASAAPRLSAIPAAPPTE